MTHSSAVRLSGSLSPGIVAQPCFLTNSPCSQALTARSCLSFSLRFGSALKRTTHIGAIRLATASSPLASAIRLAVPPVTHPPQVNPTIIVTTAAATPNQNTLVFVGPGRAPALPQTRLHLARLHGPRSSSSP